ncbi:hypothetical protein AB837_00274 [bacterium AB1]|nr:hypothetical protein AB837_00274 [bacterium AB1]
MGKNSYKRPSLEKISDLLEKRLFGQSQFSDNLDIYESCSSANKEEDNHLNTVIEKDALLSDLVDKELESSFFCDKRSNGFISPSSYGNSDLGSFKSSEEECLLTMNPSELFEDFSDKEIDVVNSDDNVVATLQDKSIVEQSQRTNIPDFSQDKCIVKSVPQINKHVMCIPVLANQPSLFSLLQNKIRKKFRILNPSSIYFVNKNLPYILEDIEKVIFLNRYANHEHKYTLSITSYYFELYDNLYCIGLRSVVPDIFINFFYCANTKRIFFISELRGVVSLRKNFGKSDFQHIINFPKIPILNYFSSYRVVKKPISKISTHDELLMKEVQMLVKKDMYINVLHMITMIKHPYFNSSEYKVLVLEQSKSAFFYKREFLMINNMKLHEIVFADINFDKNFDKNKMLLYQSKVLQKYRHSFSFHQLCSLEENKQIQKRFFFVNILDSKKSNLCYIDSKHLQHSFFYAGAEFKKVSGEDFIGRIIYAKTRPSDMSKETNFLIRHSDKNIHDFIKRQNQQYLDVVENDMMRMVIGGGIARESLKQAFNSVLYCKNTKKLFSPKNNMSDIFSRICVVLSFMGSFLNKDQIICLDLDYALDCQLNMCFTLELLIRMLTCNSKLNVLSPYPVLSKDDENFTFISLGGKHFNIQSFILDSHLAYSIEYDKKDFGKYAKNYFTPIDCISAI